MASIMLVHTISLHSYVRSFLATTLFSSLTSKSWSDSVKGCVCVLACMFISREKDEVFCLSSLFRFFEVTVFWFRGEILSELSSNSLVS